MANLREVANIANVSVSTVHAVLSGKKYVSPLLKKRVENALVQSGYIQGKQQAVVEELQKEVGLILPGTYSSYFQPLLSGIEDVACKEGYNVILCDSDRKWDLERNLFARLMERGVQNIILDSVCSSEEEADYYEKELIPLARKRGVLIYMLSRPSRAPEIGSFSIDHYKTAYEAVSYLIEQGHRKIVHICGDSTFPHAALRIQGYRMALLDHGIDFDERLLLEGNFTPLSGYATMSELMEKGINVDAVFSANDQMAIGAMKAILSAGLRIPEDVAVVGFDDLSVSSLISPSLTTVHYPIYQMGYGAMRNIVDERMGRTVEKQVELPAKLVVRRSTDASKADDWNLNRW